MEVVDVTKTSALVRRGDGSTAFFRPRVASSFEVGEERKIAVACGDKLLLQANRKLTSGSLINGQLVTVKEVKKERITLTDGRILPTNYRQFTRGYCGTSHAAQSRTVDKVFVVASQRSAPAIHREQFYVSISRGRQECRIFTDDKHMLRTYITRSTHRQSALDLVKSALIENGIIPPLKSSAEPSNQSSAHRMRVLRRAIPTQWLMQVALQTFRRALKLSQRLLTPPQQLEAPAINQKISSPSIHSIKHSV